MISHVPFPSHSFCIFWGSGVGMALKFVPNCEQLIDPVVNVQAFLLLRQMRRKEHMYAGINQCTYQLLHNKPLALILPTDLSPREATARHVNKLKKLAMLAQVPVVYAMTSQFLGYAVGYDRSPVHAVVIMSVPNEQAGELMTSMMYKVAEACRGWMTLNATANALANQPLLAGTNVDTLLTAMYAV